MAYNNLISRADSSALMPEEVVNRWLAAPESPSAVLRLFDRVPVGKNQVRFPVLSALPVAYWVTGDTGQKQTTELNWANKFLNIEEAATILAVPDNVVDDMDQNVWDQADRPLRNAFFRLIDSAIFFGTNAPASFPTNINAAALAAGNSVNEGSVAAAGAYFGDLDAALALIEADGFDMTGVVAGTSLKAKLRSARNANGDRIDPDRISPRLDELDGAPIIYPMRGMWNTASGNVRAFLGDWTQFVVGIRKDITVDTFREGVIQDNTGAIVFNLMQQDMTAIRLTMRLGWQVSNLINYDNTVEANRYPVARLMIP